MSAPSEGLGGGRGAAGREEERRAIAEHNALAAVFEAVAAASAAGVLSTPAQWAEQGLVPEHMSGEDLEMMVYDHLMAWYEEHGRPDEGGSFLASDPLASPQPTAPKGPSPFASRGVGVPPAIGGAGAGTLGEGSGEQGAPDKAGPSTALGSRLDGSGEADASSGDVPAPSLEAPGGALAADGCELVEVEGQLTLVGPDDAGDEGSFEGLRLPEGYELAELDGEYVLVQVDPDALPQRRPIRCEGVALLMGAYGYYLYDTAEMTGAYARWAFLAAEDDPLVAFVYCVREESRVYPRPMAIESFANEPFSFDAATVEALYEQAAGCDDYADIGRTEASNGDVYFYSAEHLSATQAAALAEWHSVERLRNL